MGQGCMDAAAEKFEWQFDSRLDVCGFHGPGRNGCRIAKVPNGWANSFRFLA